MPPSRRRSRTGVPHLDLRSDDPEAELARLVGLGARVLATHESLTVLADPEGNEFCLLRQPPG
jgi:predicted enzyme related to lactoylglutathione lyase